jgi:hypothetical protein
MLVPCLSTDRLWKIVSDQHCLQSEYGSACLLVFYLSTSPTQLCDGNKAAPGTTDINVEFHPEDNYYLIVHEYSGLESRAGCPRNLQTILDFISRRTDPSLEAPEKLHAVW